MNVLFLASLHVKTTTLVSNLANKAAEHGIAVSPDMPALTMLVMKMIFLSFWGVHENQKLPNSFRLMVMTSSLLEIS